MASAAAFSFTESFEAQIDDLLMRICVDLQLDDTRYQLADTNYKAVAKWLEAQSLVARFKPAIYPQGSMLLDTTVRPLTGEEYDLDFVCELICSPTYFKNSVKALDLIEDALRMSEVYKPMLERMNRCIRLNYTHKFHMDVLPACKDSENGGTCIVVPDRKLEDWVASNPKGYAVWFDGRARQAVIRELLEKAAPLPNPQPAHAKLPLKLCVQLIKRWRDIHYGGSPLAPISIVLTTLAAHAYRGEQSTMRAIEQALSGILSMIRSSSGRLIVLNPANGDEDLSERWDANPAAYREFVSGVEEFDSKWKALFQLRGIDKVARALEQLFGEEVAKRVVEKQTRDIEAARERNELVMKKGSGIVTGLATSAAISIPRNTFYGEKE